ncbi:MAG: hypothetical protein IIV02_04005, partial [Peptococcaceae bacterium]|nr:hypothetical protein [Peptococcaceae bacterium]
DDAIALVGADGIPKLVHADFELVAETDGQTEFTIPMETFDARTDVVFVTDGRQFLTQGIDYTVSDKTITVVNGWNAGDKGGLRVLKNVPAGDAGTVSGAVIADGTIPASKLADEYVKADGSVAMTGQLKYTDGENVFDYYGEHNPPSITMDLLWENASPTSDFEAQTITLPISNYKLIVINWFSANNATTRITSIFPALYNSDFLTTYMNATNGAREVRRCVFTENSIKFKEAQSRVLASGTTTTTNAIMFPLEIYGIK